MGAVIWVEILSRHREVLSRHRFAQDAVLLGRGYGCDLILDDNHVDAAHLRIWRDAEGVVYAGDCGSANGTWLTDGARLDTAPVDGDAVLRAGRTLLRIRTEAYPVAAAVHTGRHAAPQRWGIALGCGAGVLLLVTLSQWLGDIGQFNLSRYVGPLVSLLLVMLAWALGWSVVSRIFTGSMRFDRHLLIGCGAMLLLVIFDLANDLAAYAVLARVPAEAYVLAAFALLGVTAWLHLRETGPTHRRAKIATVALLTTVLAGAYLVSQLDERARSGGAPDLAALKPPFLRLAPAQSEQHFLQDTTALLPRLQKARTDAPLDNGAPTIE